MYLDKVMENPLGNPIYFRPFNPFIGITSCSSIYIWHNWLHFLPKKHEFHLGLAEKDDWTKVPKHILTNGDLIVIWLVASTHLKKYVEIFPK